MAPRTPIALESLVVQHPDDYILTDNSINNHPPVKTAAARLVRGASARIRRAAAGSRPRASGRQRGCPGGCRQRDACGSSAAPK
eukprot:1359222-Pleurochrysis_carterae.AAC.2